MNESTTEETPSAAVKQSLRFHPDVQSEGSTTDLQSNSSQQSSSKSVTQSQTRDLKSGSVHGYSHLLRRRPEVSQGSGGLPDTFHSLSNNSKLDIRYVKCFSSAIIKLIDRLEVFLLIILYLYISNLAKLSSERLKEHMLELR